MELLGHDGAQKGNVLAQELFLKADRVRRDDDAIFLLRGGSQDGGNEIGEAFAHPGGRLHHQMMRPSHGLGHGLGHVELLWPRLKVVQAAGNGPARTKDGRAGHGVYYRWSERPLYSLESASKGAKKESLLPHTKLASSVKCRLLDSQSEPIERAVVLRQPQAAGIAEQPRVPWTDQDVVWPGDRAGVGVATNPVFWECQPVTLHGAGRGQF